MLRHGQQKLDDKARAKMATIKGRSLAWENLGKESDRIRAPKGLVRRRAQHKPEKN